MKQSRFIKFLRILALVAIPSLASITAASAAIQPSAKAKARFSSQQAKQIAVQIGAIKLGYPNAKGLTPAQLSKALALGVTELSNPTTSKALIVQATQAALLFPITNEALNLNPGVITASSLVKFAATLVPNVSPTEFAAALKVANAAEIAGYYTYGTKRDTSIFAAGQNTETSDGSGTPGGATGAYNPYIMSTASTGFNNGGNINGVGSPVTSTTGH
jgi:hypothetical protein